ncbi:MAG TPA: hypothetical protein VJG32_21310 [Anaerolineae bacterium]|nr:hypothetical protein [Anaerolineae bacterium]
MVEAALGLIGGAWIAVALAGYRRVRNWQRAARIVMLAGAALAGVALIVSLAAGPQPNTIAIAAILAGGAVYALRSEAAALTLLIGGLLPTYAAFSEPHNVVAPVPLVWPMTLLAASLSLPVLEVAVRQWRRTPAQFGLARALWIVLTLGMILSAISQLIQRGAWFGASPIDAWLLAGWVAAGGSLLTRAHRPRAMLIAVAALAASCAALSA